MVRKCFPIMNRLVCWRKAGLCFRIWRRFKRQQLVSICKSSGVRQWDIYIHVTSEPEQELFFCYSKMKTITWCIFFGWIYFLFFTLVQTMLRSSMFGSVLVFDHRKLLKIQAIILFLFFFFVLDLQSEWIEVSGNHTTEIKKRICYIAIKVKLSQNLGGSREKWRTNNLLVTIECSMHIVKRKRIWLFLQRHCPTKPCVHGFCMCV